MPPLKGVRSEAFPSPLWKLQHQQGNKLSFLLRPRRDKRPNRPRKPWQSTNFYFFAFVSLSKFCSPTELTSMYSTQESNDVKHYKTKIAGFENIIFRQTLNIENSRAGDCQKRDYSADNPAIQRQYATNRREERWVSDTFFLLLLLSLYNCPDAQTKEDSIRRICLSCTQSDLKKYRIPFTSSSRKALPRAMTV